MAWAHSGHTKEGMAKLEELVKRVVGMVAAADPPELPRGYFACEDRDEVIGPFLVAGPSNEDNHHQEAVIKKLKWLEEMVVAEGGCLSSQSDPTDESRSGAVWMPEDDLLISFSGSLKKGGDEAAGLLLAVLGRHLSLGEAIALARLSKNEVFLVNVRKWFPGRGAGDVGRRDVN